jgi:hypothetical protein
VCRASAGPCDVADKCSGTSATCQDFLAYGSLCRPANGQCDKAETCDGVRAACPTDQFLPVGSACKLVFGISGRCSATGTCGN